MTVEDLFAGMDNAAYEEEVRQRWGDAAWERGQQRRESMSPADLVADDRRSRDVNAALRSAAEAGLDPTSAVFQELVANHYAWVTESWGGQPPTKEAYIGLSQMYVADGRFATVYGGEANSETIRKGIQHWAAAHL